MNIVTKTSSTWCHTLLLALMAPISRTYYYNMVMWSRFTIQCIHFAITTYETISIHKVGTLIFVDCSSIGEQTAGNLVDQAITEIQVAKQELVTRYKHSYSHMFVTVSQTIVPAVYCLQVSTLNGRLAEISQSWCGPYLDESNHDHRQRLTCHTNSSWDDHDIASSLDRIAILM